MQIKTMMAQLGVALMLLTAASAFAAPDETRADEGWIRLFDGKTLNGWKFNEGQDSFTVEDGVIVAHGGRSHLFYVGPVKNHNFKNFEFRADVMTTTGANSGIYFHTDFRQSGWPGKGFEAQVNSSHSDPKRTGSLYNIKDYVVRDLVKEADKLLSRDGKWFRYDIIVKGNQIILKIDGKTIVDYKEPESAKRADGKPGRYLSSGTFALQAHPPDTPKNKGLVYFKNIMVKPLPD